MPCRTVSGFTIIELLVSVAVISVLAAILITGVSKVMASVNNSQCVSNLRQLGVGIHMYVAEHNGQLPGPLYVGQNINYRVNQDGTVNSLGMLVSFVADYLEFPKTGRNQVNSAKSILCPAWLNVRESEGMSFGRLITGYPYQVNHHFGYPPSQNGSSPGRDPLYISSIEDPAVTMALTETDRQYEFSVRSAGLANVPVHGTHRNQLFFDGHVEAVSVEE